MITVQEIAARLTRECAVSFAKAVRATPAEKQAWSVLDQGRTVVSVLQECAVINQWMANCLSNLRVMELGEQEYKDAIAALSDVDQALYAFERNTEELAVVIEQFPSEKLSDVVQMPWATESFASLLFGAYWNTTYHLGQVAFIQTLYGDNQMHM